MKLESEFPVFISTCELFHGVFFLCLAEPPGGYLVAAKGQPSTIVWVVLSVLRVRAVSYLLIPGQNVTTTVEMCNTIWFWVWQSSVLTFSVLEGACVLWSLLLLPAMCNFLLKSTCECVSIPLHPLSWVCPFAWSEISFDVVPCLLKVHIGLVVGKMKMFLFFFPTVGRYFVQQIDRNIWCFLDMRSLSVCWWISFANLN